MAGYPDEVDIIGEEVASDEEQAPTLEEFHYDVLVEMLKKEEKELE